MKIINRKQVREDSGQIDLTGFLLIAGQSDQMSPGEMMEDGKYKLGKVIKYQGGRYRQTELARFLLKLSSRTSSRMELCLAQKIWSRMESWPGTSDSRLYSYLLRRQTSGGFLFEARPYLRKILHQKKDWWSSSRCRPSNTHTKKDGIIVIVNVYTQSSANWRGFAPAAVLFAYTHTYSTNPL
jgi:hypothetical protein